MRPVLVASVLLLLGVTNGAAISYRDSTSLARRTFGPGETTWTDVYDDPDKKDDKKDKDYTYDPEPVTVKKDKQWKRADVLPPKKDDKEEEEKKKKKKKEQWKRADVIPPKKDDKEEEKKKEWRRADIVPPKKDDKKDEEEKRKNLNVRTLSLLRTTARRKRKRRKRRASEPTLFLLRKMTRRRRRRKRKNPNARTSSLPRKTTRRKRKRRKSPSVLIYHPQRRRTTNISQGQSPKRMTSTHNIHSISDCDLDLVPQV